MAPLETDVEDDSDSMILISYGITCPLITVRLLRKDWWDQCRNISLLKNPLFSHTGSLPFSGKADVKILFFLYHQIRWVSKNSGYLAGGKKKNKVTSIWLSIYSLTSKGLFQKNTGKTIFSHIYKYSKKNSFQETQDEDDINNFFPQILCKLI